MLGVFAFLAPLYLGAASPARPVEFCPAAINIRSRGVMRQNADQLPYSADYGFELAADGARTVTTAIIAFDTNAGWFTVDVPPQTLHEKTVNYHTGSAWPPLQDREFVSPMLYARFPRAVLVNRVYVYRAAATNDGVFGWSGKGTVTCAPTPGRDVHWFRAGVDVPDADPLGAPPPSGTPYLLAQSSPALDSGTCAIPFDNIKPLVSPVADRPRYGYYFGAHAVMMRIAVATDGSVASAWVRASSGYPEVDNAVLAGALRANFQPGRAYCKPVPGYYTYWVWPPRS